MKAHPTADDLVATPLRPDVRRHLDRCVDCREAKTRLDLYERLAAHEEVLEDAPPFEDRYRVREPRGSGPRSTLHIAFDMLLERNVLLKRLSGPVDRQALERARTALDALGHPHVVPILDVPDTDPPCYTRSWVEGRSLPELADAPEPTRHAWFCQLAAALAAMHANDLCHGALRPANVRISPQGQLMLVDALVGAPLDGPERAPELLGSLDRSPSADWYAVGVLFEDGPLPELAARMRAPDPADRPSATEVLAALLIERDPSMEGHGRYRRLGSLGHGGMGEVHQVRDPVLDRVVALKSMLPDLLASDEAARRFRTEAKITAQLEHPGVIPVHEMGQLADGTPYFTMKKVRGRTLAAVLHDAPTDPEWRTARGVEILLRASEAIAYAHAKAVVHRDLKPGNLMVGDFGEVLVVDWGLAKLVGDDVDGIDAESPGTGDQSAPGVGTPGYMSPEQATGSAPVGRPADVYALGTILDEILAVRGGPAPLQAIADKARSPDPADRYPDARAFAEELSTWRSGGLVSAYDYSLVERVGRRLRPYQAPLLVAVVATAAITVVGAIGSVQVATHQRVARENLAQSLVERAQLALLADDRIPAEVYAAGAVALADRPEARGVLARLGRVPYPTLEAHREGCSSLAVGDGWAGCATDAGLAGWSPGGATWSGPTGQVWPAGSGEAVVEQLDRAVRVDLETGFAEALLPVEGPLVGVARVGDQLVLATENRVHTVDGDHDQRLPRMQILEMVGCGPDVVLFRTETHALYRWVPGKQAEVLPVDMRSPSTLACDPTGDHVAIASGSHVDVWQLHPEELQTARLTGHEARVTRLAWSDGFLATGSDDGTVRVWNPRAAAAELARLPNKEHLTGLGFVGDRLWTSTSDRLERWRVPLESRIGGFDAKIGLRAIDWSTGGALLTLDRNGRWRRADALTGANQAMVKVRGIAPPAVSARPDGAALVAGLYDGTVVALDDAQHRMWTAEAHEAGVQAVLWLPDGRVLSGAGDGSMALTDPEGRPAGAWSEAGGAGVVQLAASADGRVVLARRETGQVDRFIDGDSAPIALEKVRLVALDADGDTLATVHEDGVVRLTRDDATRPVLHLQAEALALSPDGRWLATATQRLVQVWDRDGREVARLVAHARGAADLAFSPDGDTLATAGREGQVLLWDLGTLDTGPEALVSQVEQRYGAHTYRVDTRYGGM